MEEKHINLQSERYKNSYSLIDDAITQHHPKLAVDALFSLEKREEFKQILRTEYKTVDPEILEEIMSEIVGLGKFEKILEDDTVTDIGFNGTDLWIETQDTKYKYPDTSINEEYINRVVQRFANYAHRDFSEKEPLLNTQLGNIRISATHRSISPSGTTMSMRHARAKLVITEENFEEMADPQVFELLKNFVESGSNLIMNGVVGSAKTELTKTLINFIPDRDKVIMIEDTLETHIKDIYPNKDVYNWILLDWMQPQDLISQSKRNNPIHVILTEARDHAIFQIHQSVKAGFKIMLSIHAEDPQSVPDVMIDLMKQKYNFDENRMFKEIYKHYDLGVHMEKRVLSNGKTIRYIGEVVEYTEDGIVTLYKRTLDQSNGDKFIDAFPNGVSEKKLLQMRHRNILCLWNAYVDGD